MHPSVKAVLLIFVILFLRSWAVGQQVLVPFRDGALWGYADTNGTIRIKPAYDRVEFFNYSKATAEVYSGEKIGLIDTSGRLLFPFAERYVRYGPNYIVTIDGKKGLYSDKGRELVPPRYDQLECACLYKAYRAEKDKILGFRGGRYFLILPGTPGEKPVAPPQVEQQEGSGIGIVEAPYDPRNITSVPNPQLSSSHFPRLSAQKGLVHCHTIWMNRKPVFYIFCLWKERKNSGYVGENGVLFFRD